MIMIDFEPTHFVFVSFIIAILYFVWKSTEVRRETQPFENIHAFGVQRSSSILSNASTASNSTIEDNLTSSVEELAQNIFTEASESFNSLNNNNAEIASTNGDEISEQEQIINAMDSQLETEFGMRNRRSNQLSRETTSTDLITPVCTTTTTTMVEAEDSNLESIKDEDKISIKLKYLNEEIKNTWCLKNESLESFKKRNFKNELESKLIKLIFNGKLLEDDKKSMQQCGIFSEAVVHCLILQKKNQVNVNAANQNVNQNRRGGGAQNNSFMNINFVNFEWNIIGMSLVCLTLVICWFCRLQFFSWYSSICLILLTSLFIVLIPLFSRVFS
ncbi:hypothetical protein PVAND_008674 [Polypedilum vanderplanki]|uniref:Ubiquitin-like domain-containing protein n=1 Tax=Polypedilum vanderplanki TaxID=319348 RepID=A0A9J6CAQ2_POLVA|nr:hypothetical protein PVAND_008674 [Polypedilum vanderplanki]